MPRRSKSKSKKGVHTIPQEDRRVIRNREQARKADLKRLKIASRRFKKEQRLRRQTVLSPQNDNTENRESLQHETSDEESDSEEDNHLPHFSCDEFRSSHILGQQNDTIKESKKINLPSSSRNKLSTSRTIGQQMDQKNDSEKGGKNIDLSSSSWNKPSASRITGQQVDQKSNSSKGNKNIKSPLSSSNKSNASRTPGQQADQKNASTKKCKKTGNDRKGKSLVKPKSLDLKIPKDITESQRLSSNFTETGQDYARNYSDGRNLHGSDQTKMPEEEKNKEIVGKEALKPIKSKDFASNTLNIVPTKINGKTTKGLTKKKSILQKKLKASETEIKSLDEQEKKLLPSAEEQKIIAVSGDIKVRSANESVKIGSKKWLMYSCYIPDKKMVHIGDKNIKISIHVNHGSQIVCNSRSRKETDLFQNENSISNTVESHVIAKPDGNIKTVNTEKYDETTSDTKCDSSSVSKFPSSNFQTVDDQAIYNYDTDTSIDSEYYDETATDTKGNLSSINNFSKENDSPGVNSRQEKLQEACDVYLEENKTILEKFERRVENYLKGKSISTPKI
ncbi:unnamed protein product [Larinioides sclopetarius]|uniref:Uncharacterized protein n=1 Tax=Larinioides sclopetarius TaxID=280406 RepID=A0AAV2BLU6_9ARAC